MARFGGIDQDGFEHISRPDYIQFDTTATNTRTTGKIWWDAERQTFAMGVGSASTLQVGQETHMYVRNVSNAVIPDFTLVMATGVVNDVITVVPAVTNGSVDAMYIVGITTQDIAKQGTGMVTVFGEIHDINTNAWNTGTVLWNDPAVPGGLTATKPTAPNLKLPVAMVTKKAGGTGAVMVRMTNGSVLGETDSNVQITNPQPGDVLKFNGTIWVNQQP